MVDTLAPRPGGQHRTRRRPRTANHISRSISSTHSDRILLRAWSDAPVYVLCRIRWKTGIAWSSAASSAHHATFGLDARRWHFRPLNTTRKRRADGRAARNPRAAGGGFPVHRGNGANAGRSPAADPLRDVPGGKRRPLPAHGGGAQLPPRAAGRPGRAHRADDALGLRAGDGLPEAQPRFARRRRALPRFGQALGKPRRRRTPSASNTASAANCSGTSTWASRSSTASGGSSRRTMPSPTWKGIAPVVGKRAPAPPAPDRQPPRRNGVRLARRAEDARKPARCTTSTTSTPRWKWCSPATRPRRRSPPNIYDKVRPLPGYLIEPLKPFPADTDQTGGWMAPSRAAARVITRLTPNPMAGAHGSERRFRHCHASNSPAAKFIEESVNHPEWLKTIEAGQADAVVELAKETRVRVLARRLEAGRARTACRSQEKERGAPQPARSMKLPPG